MRMGLVSVAASDVVVGAAPAVGIVFVHEVVVPPFFFVLACHWLMFLCSICVMFASDWGEEGQGDG